MPGLCGMRNAHRVNLLSPSCVRMSNWLRTCISKNIEIVVIST